MALSGYEKQKRYRDRKREASPLKACECGCGTMIYSLNTLLQPARYAHGHNPRNATSFKPGHQPTAEVRAKLFPRSIEHSRKLSEALSGRTISPEHRRKISEALMQPNPRRNALHAWLRRNYPMTGVCEGCGDTGRTEYASTNGHKYTRNRDDYAELCHSCHLLRDYADGTRLSKAVTHRCVDCGSLNVEIVANNQA